MVSLYKGMAETSPKHWCDFRWKSFTDQHVILHNVRLHRFCLYFSDQSLITGSRLEEAGGGGGLQISRGGSGRLNAYNLKGGPSRTCFGDVEGRTQQVLGWF